MGSPVIESIKPVRFGILIGLLGILFGIGWAFWLVVGHERIHQSLESRAATTAKTAGTQAQMDEVHETEPPKVKVHTHKDGSLHRHEPLNTAEIRQEGPDHHVKGHDHGETMASATQQGPDHHQVKGGHEHDNPVMALAHTRLVRGHLHAMGLGLATILISLIMAFTTASARVKTTASVLTGLGGIIYPFAWIVMGFVTPSLGPEAAEASVVFIAGPGVGLVLLGVFSAVGFILRDSFKRS